MVQTGIIIYIIDNKLGGYADMNNNKKQVIKDQYILNKITADINDMTGISMLNAYYNSSVCINFVEQLNKIYKIGFPILFTKERGHTNNEYVNYLYQYFKLPTDSYNWLIPNFEGSNWWIELNIRPLDNFINLYYPSYKSINLTAIDIKNRLLFDIENGESDIEYRIIWL